VVAAAKLHVLVAQLQALRLQRLELQQAGTPEA
jgi:hypothetical protein